ncbi:class A beta-lactamase [Thalassobius sp. I31.1]|uniref:class A beta-lactamase n=1 Tax=Thalassobius sp. I31.1 TaxID=2109912 RepID=UPI0013005318|nr:class A beta-lactamase [Thalassobius sp. I31.1]
MAYAATIDTMFKLSKQVRIIASGLVLGLCSPIGAYAEPIIDAIRSIERDLGARVGFYMHDTQTGEVIAYAEDDRFPLNSTFKLLACGALLNRVDNREANLTDKVRLRDFEFVDYSPALEAHSRAGNLEVSLGTACGMMLSVSDNTAANIVLSAIGGPEGLTDYLRSIGDQVTRLDRWETELNMAVPGDPRDTTTPRAIAQSAQDLILGDALEPASQATLRAWLADHRVADALFRAALPPSWSIDDRTGAGGFGSRSIVAVIYPPNREPIIASLFMTQTNADFDSRNTAAARVGAALVEHITEE